MVLFVVSSLFFGCPLLFCFKLYNLLNYKGQIHSMGYLPKVLSYKKRRKSTDLAYVLILITIERTHTVRKEFCSKDVSMIKFTKNFYQKGVRKKVISLGLDSGSSMTKAVLFKDDHIIKTKMIPTSISPRKSLEELYLDMINEKGKD